jgi:hypothetical protein
VAILVMTRLQSTAAAQSERAQIVVTIALAVRAASTFPFAAKRRILR